MTVKITGLDKLDEAQRALKSLDGTIAKLKFDPNDAQSVKNAIKQVETAIDRKVAPYGRNPIVSKVAQATKDQYRKQILEQAKKNLIIYAAPEL